MIDAIRSLRTGQYLTILDINNPAPGPVVSGAMALLHTIFTGKTSYNVSEVVS